MQFQPYLNFDGNCAEAMKTYERVFGGKLERMMRFADMPPPPADATGCAAMPLPPGAGERVLHAALSFEGGLLMASDAMPGQPYEGMKNMGVAVSFPTVARAREVADALAEGGTVQMPLGETFWVEAFASLVDRFGVCWLINGGKSKL